MHIPLCYRSNCGRIILYCFRNKVCFRIWQYTMVSYFLAYVLICHKTCYRNFQICGYFTYKLFKVMFSNALTAEIISIQNSDRYQLSLEFIRRFFQILFVVLEKTSATNTSSDSQEPKDSREYRKLSETHAGPFPSMSSWKRKRFDAVDVDKVAKSVQMFSLQCKLGSCFPYEMCIWPLKFHRSV